MAVELHHIVRSVQQFCSVSPPHLGYGPREAANLVDALLRFAPPQDAVDIANEAMWLALELDEIGADELYVRYVRVLDRIQGTQTTRRFSDPWRPSGRGSAASP